MKHILYVLILFMFLLSCRSERAKVVESDVRRIEISKLASVKKLAKLDSLMSLSKDSVIEYFDLSGDSIKIFPDLSGYAIKSLNLSNNQLDTLIMKHLPQKLERLKISHNKLKGAFWVLDNTFPHLKEIDISFNNIKRISVSESLYRIIASHNDLRYVTLDHGNIQYLDVSFNPHLSNEVGFYPSKIDTIIREGIANDDSLYNPAYHPLGRIISED